MKKYLNASSKTNIYILMLNIILMIPINVVTKTMIINYNVSQAYDPENVYIIGMLSKLYLDLPIFL